MKKSDQKVIIPLHPVVLAILKKRNGIPPAAISNQKMNKYIKEVGKLAELNELVAVSKTRAGQKDCAHCQNTALSPSTQHAALLRQTSTSPVWIPSQ
jgi:hypothetical protein